MADITTDQTVSERETHPRVPERIGGWIELYLRVADRLAKAIWVIAIVMATTLTLIVISQVVTRYVLGYITTWGNELARYLMIWFAVLLMGVLIYEDNHLQVEILFQKLSARAQRLLRSAQLLLIAGFGSLLADYGFIWTSTSGFYSTTPALESVTPFEFYMAYLYVVVPIGGVLIVFFSIGKLLEINYYPSTLQNDYAARFDTEAEVTDADTDKDVISDEDETADKDETVDEETKMEVTESGGSK